MNPMGTALRALVLAIALLALGTAIGAPAARADTTAFLDFLNRNGEPSGGDPEVGSAARIGDN